MLSSGMNVAAEAVNGLVLANFRSPIDTLDQPDALLASKEASEAATVRKSVLSDPATEAEEDWGTAGVPAGGAALLVGSSSLSNGSVRVPIFLGVVCCSVDDLEVL